MPFEKGHPPYWTWKGRHLSEAHRKRLSEAKRGEHSSPSTEFKKGNVPHNTGERFVHSGTFKSGPDHPNWKGGLTPLLKKLRSTSDYRQWQKAVWERDDYTCQECGKRGGKLDAHHIRSFAEYPELRFAVSNGITLCKDCHHLTKEG